jgi:hypothetical protein
MTDQEFENLAKRYPDLFQKAQVDNFAIGIGWLPIVETLCNALSYNIENARSRLKYAIDNPTAKFSVDFSALEAAVATELEKLPVIVQVKEKFGGLRFYTNGGTPEMHNYIHFAEMISRNMCEECGAPGKTRNGRWIRTLCEKHHKESGEED